MRQIPATIVTGFLGAGKTSLIRHLLAAADGRRLALIVNEFGELGIDRELLLGCGDAACTEDEIIELANGCICCTVADDFLPTMQPAARPRRAARPHRHRDLGPGVAEAAGAGLRLARDPHPRDGRRRRGGDRRGGRWRPAASPTIRQPWRGNGRPTRRSITTTRSKRCSTISSPAPIWSSSTRPTSSRRDPLSMLRRDLEARLRPGVKLVDAEHGRVAPAVALGLAAAAEDDLAARPSLPRCSKAEHDHDDFESFVVEAGPVADAAAVPGASRRADPRP